NLRRRRSPYRAVPRGWSDIRDPNMDLVRCRRRRSLCARLQRDEFSLVPSRKAGRISAAGMTKEVIFELVQGSINDRIDDAYRAKYRSSEYLNSMIGTRARAATVKIIPREIAS